jgi:DNA (cytosine-5)-methyltransferase 1
MSLFNVLSLFSGVGGFDLGLERAGMTSIFQCEIDKHCQKVLNRHWPDVPKWDNIETLTGKYILENAPEIDVVAWGSPCQDLSLAGKRAGLEGKRSGLFYEGIRIIKELRELTNGQYPRISIWENVAGALSSNDGRDFGQIIYEMEEAGANFSEWIVLDAQFFGVPQRRRRVFVVSIFDLTVAARSPEPLFTLGESLQRNFETSQNKKQKTTRETTPSLGDYSDDRIIGSLNTSDAKYISNQYVQEGKCIVFSDDRRNGPKIHEDTMPSLQAFMGTGGNNTPLVAEGKESTFGINGRIIGRKDENGPNGRPHTLEDGPMFTLTHTDIHAVSQEMSVRRLTPIECERLMGWPDNWTDGQTDGHRYKQCGNGVASPVATWIGLQLRKVLEHR